MIDAEVEVGDARHPNFPAPEHSFALKLDDDLAVRLSERHHAESIYRLVERDRSHLERWVPWTAEATKESVRQLVVEELERFGSGGGWRGELCHEGRPVGLLWLHDWGGAGGSTEIGYLIAKEHEGKGLVTRALKGLIRHFFEDRAVGRVAIGLDARNDRSLGVVQRLGLKPEAVLRRLIVVDGEPTDLSMFGLLREEYEAEHGRSDPHRRPPRFALTVDPAEDLYLAIYEQEDAQDLHRLVDANRERLLPWMPWAKDSSPEAELRFVTQRAVPALVSGNGLEVGIWSSGRLIGSAGLHDVHARSRSAAIGYWLDAGHQGRGIVTRVVRALVERCFTEPLLGGEPFERLEVTADVNNLPSRAVPERLGFQFEGVLRRNNVGGYTPDTAVYSILRSEWEGSRRPNEDVPSAAVIGSS